MARFWNAIFCCIFVATVVLSAPSSKLEPKLSATLKANNSANIIVKFQGENRQVIRSAQRSRFGTRTQKINHLVTGLQRLSQSSQKNALSLLRSRSLFSAADSHEQLWATNELYVKGASIQLINQLAALPEVTEIREERIISLEQLKSVMDTQVLKSQNANVTVGWNLDIIQVPQAWQLPGAGNGQGIIVAGIDSGVRHTHEALRNNFRGDYGWFDPAGNSEVPVDDSGHGTHTMGTIAGSGGIGVAPGAQWMACRSCDVFCTEYALKACGQWVLCPTLANGTNRDCDKAPQVVSNSWGGGQGSDWYNDIIEAWKAANIIPVFANGNAGPNCGTAMSPGDQDVIAVGATTSEDNIWNHSSVGPSVQGKVKPDISAPGHLVRSAGASSDAEYYATSGTSMACPHVSGVVALLLSQNPSLNYAQVKNILESSSDRSGLVDTGRVCGGIPSTQFPNNQYGHGRLNARKALEQAIKLSTGQ